MIRSLAFTIALSGCASCVAPLPPIADAGTPSDALVTPHDAPATPDAYACPGRCEYFGAVSYWYQPYVRDESCATSVVFVECRGGCDAYLGCPDAGR